MENLKENNVQVENDGKIISIISFLTIVVCFHLNQSWYEFNGTVEIAK